MDFSPRNSPNVNADAVLNGQEPIATIFNGADRIDVYLQDRNSVEVPKNLLGLAIGKQGANIKRASQAFGLRGINLVEGANMDGDEVRFRWNLPQGA